MNTHLPDAVKGHNPDVLSAIANLSSDLVFTDPVFAGLMLDGVESSWRESGNSGSIWSNPQVTFFDPACKSGVYLREVVSRLSKGLAEQIPDTQERINHILTRQVFGLALEDLTALMARRTVYCSKKANDKFSICTKFDDRDGNIWLPEVSHRWGKAARGCLDCGASRREYDRSPDLASHAYPFLHEEALNNLAREKFGTNDMKFDVIIGNPPYQMSTGGGTQTKQAKPIYHKFVEQALAMSPRIVSLVIPSRWFAEGFTNLEGFRDRMMKDRRIRKIVDYPDSREVFGDQGPAGGVHYFIWDSLWDGPCEFVTVRQGEQVSSTERYLDTHEVIIRDKTALDVIGKVEGNLEGSLQGLVSAISPFGLPTSFNGLNSEAQLKDAVRIRTSKGDTWLARSDISKGVELVDSWKVLLSATSSEHAGQPDKSGFRRVFSRIEVLPPGTAVTHSYLILGPAASEQEAKNIAGYLQTKFVRYLVSVIQSTQHISRGSFKFVPKVDFKKAWTDELLYRKFDLSDEEIQVIQSQIKEL